MEWFGAVAVVRVEAELRAAEPDRRVPRDQPVVDVQDGAEVLERADLLLHRELLGPKDDEVVLGVEPPQLGGLFRRQAIAQVEVELDAERAHRYGLDRGTRGHSASAGTGANVVASTSAKRSAMRHSPSSRTTRSVDRPKAASTGMPSSCSRCRRIQ